MTSVTRWWWIRHAPVTTDGGRIYGQTDLPADCSDRSVFAGLADAMPAGAVWLASHLQRTHQTAAAIRDAGHAAPEPIAIEALAEQHFGEWQGQSRKEVFAKFGADHGFWLAPAEHAPPGGESFAELMRRVSEAIDRLTVEHAGRDIVAVTHGGTIRAAMGHALGLTPARSLGFVVDNCSLTRLDHVDGGDGGSAWRIAGLNLRPGR